MTTDDLTKGLPAAYRARLRGVTRTLFCTTALCLASLSAQAQVAAPGAADDTSVQQVPPVAMPVSTDVVAMEAAPAPAVAAPAPDQAHPILIGQPQIDDGQIQLMLLAKVVSFLRIGGRVDQMAKGLQLHAQVVTQQQIIFDQ